MTIEDDIVKSKLTLLKFKIVKSPAKNEANICNISKNGEKKEHPNRSAVNKKKHIKTAASRLIIILLSTSFILICSYVFPKKPPHQPANPRR